MQELIMNFFTEMEVESAFKLAKQKRLPILIDFWAPDCKGCKKMEISTYQNTDTLTYIDNHFIFVKYEITNKNAHKIDCSPLLWTPTFVVFSSDGDEMRKISGYLSNPIFKYEMEIGRALAFLRKNQPSIALTILEALIGNKKYLAPEALYWAGVSSYFLNKRNADSITPYWERLIANYPVSVWAEKADCLNIQL